jgi:predicted alpha-1,2-mannosidase
MSKRGGGFELYFVLKTKQAMTGSGTWKDGKLDPASKSQKGASIGAWMTFAKTTNNEPIEFQVGISFVSIEQAKANLAAEQKGWTFETTRKQTSDAWEALLSTIKIAGGTKKQRRIFYTSMYHSFQMPTILADVDGTYRGFDKQVHTSKDFVYYSDFSMWDTYRTLHPLLVLLTPKRQRDMIHSLLAMARQGGDLPRWPLATGYTSTMIGASADIIIADSYLKGIKDFDVAFAYQVMRRLAMKSNPAGSKFGGRGGIEHYISKGFVDASKHSGSASMTMEYAYNDFSIAQLAKALGKTEDHKLFMERSTYYKNNWDKDTQFFRGKTTDGKWLPDFDPLKWTKDYVEGTAWQYLWFVPHDPDGLVSLFGSKDALFKKLDTFWTKSKDEHDNEPASLGPRKYYWHGNEPDLHAAFVYLQLGQAAKSHKWLRWIMENKYDDTPAGLPGNDDCGTLSAWYIFNAIGLYPIPGRDLYLISTPIFTRSQINVQGKTIEILAPKTSAKAIYVKAVYLNGKKLPDMWLKHTDLNQDGNVLRFEMSETP